MGSIRPALILGACIVLLLSGCDTPTGLDKLPSDGAHLWEQTQANIRVQCLATDEFGSLFAGTPVGLFRSVDQGDNWTVVRDERIHAVAVNDAGHIFAASSVDLFRSVDQGDNWTAIGSGLPHPHWILSLAINDDGLLYAGVPAGVYRSYISYVSGIVWKQGIATEEEVDCLVLNRWGHVFAGTRGRGVYRSEDHGQSWKRRRKDFKHPVIKSLAVTGEGTLFAGTTSDLFVGAGVYRSTDNGASWTRVLNLGSHICWALAIDARGHVFAGTDYRVIRSTDNGASWTQSEIMSGAERIAVLSLAFDRDGVLFAGTTQGLFRSIQAWE